MRILADLSPLTKEISKEEHHQSEDILHHIILPAHHRCYHYSKIVSVRNRVKILFDPEECSVNLDNVIRN